MLQPLPSTEKMMPVMGSAVMPTTPNVMPVAGEPSEYPEVPLNAKSVTVP